MDTKQSPTNLGLSFGGANCLVVFPTHFNPNNSLLIFLQNFTPIHVYLRLKGHCASCNSYTEVEHQYTHLLIFSKLTKQIQMMERTNPSLTTLSF